VVGEITLVPLTEAERAVFFAEEVANYADQQVRDAGWPGEEALERAQGELTPVLEREYAEGVVRGDRLWSAVASSGRTVGWIWVKPLPNRAVFLEQMTVGETSRRHGYGRAMLAALEVLLARDGIDELRLNVFRGNEPARALYESAGYEQTGGDERKLFLRKRLRA
jgi:ribosomal protein S18 acetylase RimI-like enzyme